MPFMQEWIEAARAEPEELEELDVEFYTRISPLLHPTFLHCDLLELRARALHDILPLGEIVL